MRSLEITLGEYVPYTLMNPWLGEIDAVYKNMDREQTFLKLKNAVIYEETLSDKNRSARLNNFMCTTNYDWTHGEHYFKRALKDTLLQFVERQRARWSYTTMMPPQ